MDDMIQGDTKKISVEIDHHEKECDEKNKLRFMSKVTFTNAALSFVLAIIAAISAYFAVEAAQNERMVRIEQKISIFESINTTQYNDIISRLDKLTRKKNGVDTDIN